VKYIIFIAGSVAQIIWSQEDGYQEFQKYMTVNNGRVLKVEIYQEQYGDQFISNGILYYFGNKDYTFDNLNQRISYRNNEIITINKLTKQVIYDSVIPNDVNIFDVLIGQESNLKIGTILLEKNGFRIPFFLKKWKTSGILWTVQGTGEPKKIILTLKENTEIQLKVKSLELDTAKNLTKIDTSGYEIINLRE